MNYLLKPRWKMAARVIPIVAAISAVKLIVHYYDLEFITMSRIFVALISANIFLISFNISGVLSNFKKGEELLAKIASAIEAIADECVFVYKGSKLAAGKEGFIYCIDFNNQVLRWLYKQIRTRMIMKKIEGFTDIFLKIEPASQPSFLSRLKHEQSEIRWAILRVHNIREVKYSNASYAIAEIITFLMITGLVFLNFDPYYENLFSAIFVSFIFVYMLLLIRDLDDPFAYYDSKHSVEEVSLHSLENLKLRLESRLEELESMPQVLIEPPDPENESR